MEAFVYIWHNLTNDCKYLGYHKGELDDGYINSSLSERFWNDYTNPEMLWKRRIKYVGSRDDCYEYEQQLLKIIDLRSDEWYNNARGASIIFTQEVRDKIKNHHIGKPSGMLGKNHSQASKDRMSAIRKGLPLSEEHKKNLRKPRQNTENMRGHFWNQLQRDQISKSNLERAKKIRLQIYGTEEILSTAYKNKLRLQGKGTGIKRPQINVECPHCLKIGKKPAMVKWHFDNCRTKPNDL